MEKCPKIKCAAFDFLRDKVLHPPPVVFRVNFIMSYGLAESFIIYIIALNAALVKRLGSFRREKQFFQISHKPLRNQAVPFVVGMQAVHSKRGGVCAFWDRKRVRKVEVRQFKFFENRFFGGNICGKRFLRTLLATIAVRIVLVVARQWQ